MAVAYMFHQKTATCVHTVFHTVQSRGLGKVIVDLQINKDDVDKEVYVLNPMIVPKNV